MDYRWPWPYGNNYGRFKLADMIIFVDFPLWRHLFLALKRQVKALWKTREELPQNCSSGE